MDRLDEVSQDDGNRLRTYSWAREFVVSQSPENVVESTILCSNNRAVRFVTTLFATLVLAPTFLVAGPRPTLSVKGLTNAADLIIVGRVQRIQQTGAGEIRAYGVDYPRLDYAANINVDETIKGEPIPRRFVLTFSTSIADTWDDLAPPQGGLLADTYREIFLKKTASGYKFVSPYSSSVPASPKPCGPNWRARLGDEDAYHKVLQRMLNLLCTDSTAEEKQSALFVLEWNQDSAAAPMLKAALDLSNVKSNPTLRMLIVGDLLYWRDLRVLPLAEEDLFDQSVQSPFYPKSNLVRAISTLDPQISVPLLARVLKSPVPEERAAAAYSLQYPRSGRTLHILLTALDDPDSEVQFAVMQSLGNITKEYQWRPTTTDDSRWNACIRHWREFEGQQKLGAK